MIVVPGRFRAAAHAARPLAKLDSVVL